MAIIPTYKQGGIFRGKQPKSSANTPVNQNTGAPPAPRVKATKVPSSTYSPTPTVQAVTPSIYDSAYATNTGKLLWQRNNTVNDLTTSQSYDDADFATALSRRAARLPEDQLAAKNNANKAGLFYSGAYGKQQGQINDQYANDVTDLTTGHTRRSIANSEARTRADEGLYIDTVGEGDNALARQVQRDIASPPPAPVPGMAAAGGTGSVDIPGELHRFAQMAKNTKSPTALKNIAAYWLAFTGELKKQNQPVPAAPSALLKYLP